MSAVNYRQDIQGLRAIAVLAVMAFHFNPAWLPGGFVGVDVFLVISGFLITSILLHRKNQADYSPIATLKYFYLSRFKRIAPAYFVMLVVVALVAAVCFLPQDFNTFRKGLEKAAWFNSSNYFAGFGDYFAPANHEQPLLHTWSLAVEIQFYLLAPFLVLLLPIHCLKWVFTGLFIGLTVSAEYRMRILGIEQATYYSLYARLPEFFAGALSALYVKTGSGGGRSPAWLGTVGLVLIVTATITQPLLGPFPGIGVLLPVVGSVLLLSQQAQGWVGKWLTSKALMWIGALSYSLYLWHWPVLAFLRYYTGAEVLRIEFSLLFVLLTLMLSIASYYGVERVFRIKRTKKKQALGWALLAAVVLGTSQSMAKVNSVVSSGQLPIEYRRYADPETICHGKIVGDCLVGDLTSNEEVLVLGDSHAAMLNQFFDNLGKSLGFKAKIITASSCVTIPGFNYKRLPTWAHKACTDQIETAQTHIAESDSIIIAGMWSYQTQSVEFISMFDKFLATSIDKRIVVLSQVPLLNRNPLRDLRFSFFGIRRNRSESIDAAYQEANQLIELITDKYSNVSFLRLDGIPLFDDPPFYNDLLIYSDSNHLNKVGSGMYGDFAAPLVQSIFNSK